MAKRFRSHSTTLFLLAAVLLFIVYKVTSSSKLSSVVTPAKSFLFTASATVPTTPEGRTNIVVLGRGGEGHQSPDLTDTIIFASVNPTSDKVTLISLPRDIWSDELKAKINSAFYWGKERSNEKEGLEKAKLEVEKIIGQKIHYAVVVDFSGFKRMVDAIGGVDVEVQNSFTDPKFPIAGKENDECGGDNTYACRYETISFEKGIQYMDGTTALKFVRSRHSEDENGSDIARAARQQQLIKAIRNKILTTEVVFSPNKLTDLITVVEGSIYTDIPSDVGGVLGRWGYESRESINSYVLPEEYLYNPPISKYRYFGAYVFVPRKGNWNEVHEWVKSVLP